MAAIPFMPLYVADYLSDAAHLTTLEHGAYFMLLMTYWQRGEPLPDDDKKLARIARLGPREWKRIRPTISEFFEVGCDEWSHRRVERELANVRAKSLKKRAGGLARAKQLHGYCIATVKQSDTDTDTEFPLDKSKGVGADSDKAFWDNAKAYLGPSKAGMIGKWVKEYGKEETAKAITASQLARAVDPVPYIQQVLKKSCRSEIDGRMENFV